MFRADGRRVIMKNDLRKAFELMKFGICVNKGINIGVLVLFVVIGLVGETFYLATGFTMNYGFDLFAFLLIAVLSFPAQFMVTTDVSHIVQTSSYKKKIQTKMFAEVSLITSLAAMTFLVFIRTIASAVHPDLAAKLWNDIPIAGIMTMMVLILTAIMYKYFWIAMVVWYVFMMGIGGRAGYLSVVKGPQDGLFAKVPVLGDIVIAYAFVLLGVGISYLISLALYKRPFSKAAFGAAMSKYVS